MKIAALLKDSGIKIKNATHYACKALHCSEATPGVKTSKFDTKGVLKRERRNPLQYFSEKVICLAKKIFRSIPFSLNPKVAEIEKSLAQKGINVRFQDNYEMAILVERALTAIQKEGFNLPKDIIFTPDAGRFKNRMGKVPQFSKKTAPEAPIYLSENYISLRQKEIRSNNIAYEKYKINYTSTNDLEGIIFHEIGHWLHCHEMPDKKTCENIWKTVNEKKVVSEVSFSVRDNKFGKDFVAEVFAGLMGGKRYSDYVMDIYKQLHGPMPKSLSIELNTPVLNCIN